MERFTLGELKFVCTRSTRIEIARGCSSSIHTTFKGKDYHRVIALDNVQMVWDVFKRPDIAPKVILLDDYGKEQEPFIGSGCYLAH